MTTHFQPIWRIFGIAPQPNLDQRDRDPESLPTLPDSSAGRAGSGQGRPGRGRVMIGVLSVKMMVHFDPDDRQSQT